MEREMERELRFHIERFTEDLVRAGVPIEEARRRAGAEFGAVEARKEECREALRLRLFDELRGDLRYAFRMLRKAPAFATVAILSLAIGIGANTALFSLVNGVLLNRLPYPHPDQLVALYTRTPDGSPATTSTLTFWIGRTTTIPLPHWPFTAPTALVLRERLNPNAFPQKWCPLASFRCSVCSRCSGEYSFQPRINWGRHLS
jgi:hypothetical protein